MTPLIITCSDPLGDTEPPISIILRFVRLQVLVFKKSKLLLWNIARVSLNYRLEQLPGNFGLMLREPVWEPTLACKSWIFLVVVKLLSCSYSSLWGVWLLIQTPTSQWFYLVLSFINNIKDTGNCKALKKHKEVCTINATPQVTLCCITLCFQTDLIYDISKLCHQDITYTMGSYSGSETLPLWYSII